MTIITLDNLLEEIAAEPLNNCLSSKEKRFLNDLEYLKTDDFELYIKYCTKYEKIRNKKLINGF